MSQVSAPFGFRAVDQRGGGTLRPWGHGVASRNGQVGYNGISPTNANPIYIGQAVTLVSGFITQAATNTTTGIGIFEGCSYDDPVLGNQVGFWPGYSVSGVTNIVANVATDESIDFEVQLDGAPSTPQAMIGATANLSATNTTTGSAQNFQSNSMLSATYSASGAGMFQVRGYKAVSYNALTDAYPIVIARISQPIFAASNSGQ